MKLRVVQGGIAMRPQDFATVSWTENLLPQPRKWDWIFDEDLNIGIDDGNGGTAWAPEGILRVEVVNESAVGVLPNAAD